jgi:hypothetical protein
MTSPPSRKQSGGMSAMRWPLVFGIGAALTILTVTIVRGMHDRGTQGDAAQTTAMASQGPGHARTPPPRMAATSAHVIDGGAVVDPRLSTTVAGIVARRKQMHKRISESGARFKEAAVARYAKEPRDPAWASAQQRKLAEVGRELSVAGVERPRDMVSDCHRTVCKTIASFANTDAADQWALLYMANLGETAKRSVVSRSPGVQGGTTIEIYSVSER